MASVDAEEELEVAAELEVEVLVLADVLVATWAVVVCSVLAFDEVFDALLAVVWAADGLTEELAAGVVAFAATLSTTCVLPVAMNAASSAVTAAAVAPVQRVIRLTERRLAVRILVSRVFRSVVMDTGDQGGLANPVKMPVSLLRAHRGESGRSRLPFPGHRPARMRSRSALLVAALAAVCSFAGSAAPAKQPGALDLIQQGLAQAAAAGQLDQTAATGYTSIAKQAVAELPTIPPLRAQTLSTMLSDIAAQAPGYTGPWALTLFSMLQFNEQELATHPLPSSGTDRYGDDGVLYRFVKGHGFEFHPLAEFGALNTLTLAGNTDGAKQLADALVARGEPKDGRLLWSYPFPFGRGQPPWRSGMAQAVAAQALARVGQALGDQTLLTAADQAYAAIPGRLVRALPAGPWIKLYSFDDAPVLNAQLQSVISIGDYAQISGNTGAAGLAAEMQAAAEALLPKFDTGYWSLYSLAGKESPLSYHDYVVSLLKRLAGRTSDTTWSDFATRFQSYETQPPVLKPSVAATPDTANPIVIYPDPQDGYLDTATFSFWLSKLSTVTLHAGGRTQSLELGHGNQSIVWAPGRRAAGTYYPYLTAVDAAGNTTRITLREVLMKALVAPVVDAHIAGKRTLVWNATDEGTPWLHLVVRLDNGTTRRYRDLGHQPLAGRLVLAVPSGAWQATLVAGNSAHQAVTVDLSSVTGR